jgi:hypothetical protein
VTQNEFRKLALSFHGAEERSHMNHPDFRANGRIFATLSYPDATRGMVSLTPEQQADFVHDAPRTFTPVPGGWGLKGATYVRLTEAKAATLSLAMEAAYANVMAKPSGKKSSPKTPTRSPLASAKKKSARR